MRILIADGQESVRVMVEREPGWEFCGVAENGREAIGSSHQVSISWRNRRFYCIPVN
jgi:hypothetical protein